jgi:hypothetical protein
MCKHSFFHTRDCSGLLLFVSLFVFDTAVYSQDKPGIATDSLSKKYGDSRVNKFTKERPYYLAISGKPGIPQARVMRKLDDKTAIIEISSAGHYDSLEAQTTLIAANDNWKLSPGLERTIKKDRQAPKKFILTAVNIDALLRVLKEKHKALNILYVNRPSRSLVVRSTAAFIETQLLGLKEVIFVDVAAEARPEIRIIGYDRTLHGINALDYMMPGANGKNIVAGVKEQKMDENDMDLWKRVLPSSLTVSTTSYHATVIASIIGGAGNGFYDGRGQAWACRFFSTSFSNLFADDVALLTANKVSVQNHSYGTIIQQFYGAEAVSYDMLAWADKSLVPVFSAGNQGEAVATEGRYINIPGYANLTGNFKMAKNIISVGAIDNKESIPIQSSAGPLYDGRIAPQLAALGPNGTSDAAAVVSGAVAVMQQVYADSNNNVLPAASLTKAILYNNAQDIYTPGIDYKTGYGLLDSYASVNAFRQRKYDGGSVTNGQQWTKNISVPANAAEFKITLAWTDSAASVNNNTALTNDLDLEVVQTTTGAVFLPWVLNTSASADSLAKQPNRKRDSLNTAEQVSIRLPAAGNYEVRVKGVSVINPPMPFHISFKVDTLNTFSFTSPLHSSDVIREENPEATIRWKTFVADTNQVAGLYISYNRGGSWILIGQPKLAAKKFLWAIKDTATVARLKMQTAFGDFFSNEFMLGKLTQVQVDFNCTDSFRLSWNRNVFANSYRLFTLADSPYLKPIQVLADTFVVLQKAGNSSRIYAVEPVSTVGVPAARSRAIDITLQAVNCFYKALNYNLLDNNKLNLLLELSVASYADSIFFEKVTATGQLLQQYGAAKANDATLLYTQLVNELPAGLIYIRARIKLKSGASVYTDIIAVLTSGREYIYFYPNPVSRNMTLNYSLRQGVPTSAKLQLFDIYGRLLRTYLSMPGTIKVAGLMPGVIIYKLLTSENKTLATGRFVIL